MKKIIVTGVVLLIIIIGGVYLVARSTSEPETPSGSHGGVPALTTIPEEGEVTLALGETAAFKGFLVTPISVVEDSRCPEDVQCIQAGTVRVKLEISSGLGTSTQVVKLGDFVTTEAEKVTFTQVDPQKRSNETINPEAYRFTVKVEKIPATNAS